MLARKLVGGIVGVTFAADELDHRVWPEDPRGCDLQGAAEAFADPSTGLWMGFEEQPLGKERACSQRLEPDPVGGLINGNRELCLHARPGVFELGAHGSVDPPSREK